jgi:F-type H+-transporting ATPase subunit epsilon
MAEAAQLSLEIVTPDGVKLSEQVNELTAPSVEGEFGVLPGHIPLLAALKTGIVSYKKDSETQKVAVGAGFVEILNDKALLLTDRFIKKEDVDPVRARLELKEADEALDKFEGVHGGPEHGELVSKELWAATQLELYGDPPPPALRGLSEFQLGSLESYTEDAEESSADGDAGSGAEKH